MRRFVWQRVGIWAIGGALWCVTSILLAIATPLGERALAIWRSPASLDAIEDKLDEVVNRLDQATGEDRVIRELGLSYVEEPVYQGENVILHLSVERTRLGRGCRLINSIPLFTDERNITLPGRRVNPGAPRRQISDTPTRLRTEWVPPRTLEPGRVELALALEYDCDGTIVPESTRPVPFELVAGPRPDTD
ncbi:hypothetical protein [Citreimonas sp.]|uniref:hypothetical protein n=1 Tax=Citreimonas sp. TaxID=3036715 RepID=UPI00405982B1